MTANHLFGSYGAMQNPFIRKLEYGASLEDGDRDLLQRLTARSDRVPARHDIVREGDDPTDAHLIMEGYACRYKLMPNGKRQVMAFFVPGDLCDFHVQILGEMDHGIATLTSARVVTVPPSMIEAMTANPRINRALWWMTLVDEGTLREWLVNLGQRPAAERIAHLLCELRLRLRSVGLAEGDSFDFPLTQADLSEAMGLTAVHVNRSLMQLRADGLIILDRKRLTIPDYDKLRIFAGFRPNYLHLSEGKRGIPKVNESASPL